MPELPEVQTIINKLIPLVEGKTIQSVNIFNDRCIDRECNAFSGALINQTVTRLFRRGKYLCFSLANGSLLTIHLRMTGKLLQSPTEKEKKYIRALFSFNNDLNLYFVDVRKFGHMKIWLPDETLLPKLGPEPLEPSVVKKVLESTHSTRFIKTLLLDQHILAGIGNIYADESLFQAGIHPKSKLSEIKPSSLNKLSNALPQILLTAINNNGTTLSDYRTPDSKTGNHQHFLKVYDRKGLPCFTCNTPIERIVLNGRSSHFCPHCQKINFPK